MGGTDEKQNEYKSLRTRREPATAPAWALSWGIEMAKTENRKPGLDMMDLEPKGELPTLRSSFSIFDPKTHLAIYGPSLYRDEYHPKSKYFLFFSALAELVDFFPFSCTFAIPVLLLRYSGDGRALAGSGLWL